MRRTLPFFSQIENRTCTCVINKPHNLYHSYFQVWQFHQSFSIFFLDINNFMYSWIYKIHVLTKFQQYPKCKIRNGLALAKILPKVGCQYRTVAEMITTDSTWCLISHNTGCRYLPIASWHIFVFLVLTGYWCNIGMYTGVVLARPLMTTRLGVGNHYWSSTISRYWNSTG